MNNYRLTFNSSTNLTLPAGVYDILYCDTYYFKFLKNNKPNLSGFMNHLIPILSEYQDDLHNKLLEYNNNNEEITKIVEQSIHNVYLSPFNFRLDAKVNVPFRINREHYEDFIFIHDVKLSHYNTDFTNFVRNLLVEYATKSINQREYLYSYKIIKILKNAIKESFLCHFYTHNEKISFIPVAIEVSPTSRKNLIVGCNFYKEESVILELAQVKSVIMTHQKLKITNEDCDALCEAIDKYFKEEHIKCLG